MAKRQSGKKLINSAMIDEFITDYRKRYNITQKELAESLGVKQSRISSIENGGGHYDIEDVCNFAIEYEQSIDDMIDLASRSESAPKREKTFKDILSRLFYIEHEARCSSRFCFHITEQGDYRSVDIQFKSANIINIIDQWVASNSINTKSKSGQYVSDIIKDALLKDAIDIKKKYDYLSESDFVFGVLQSAKDCLHRAGFYFEGDDEYYNLRGADYDEYTGQPKIVEFPFSRYDYEIMCKYFEDQEIECSIHHADFVMDEIDILMKDNAVKFKFDLHDFIKEDFIQE